MLCIACAKPGWPLCWACERDLVVTHDRNVAGVGVGSPFLHTGTAVRLVHNLKYRRSRAAGTFLAEAMARRVPPDATALVPVRRSMARRVRFGIDQAVYLAAGIAAMVHLPVLDVLRAPVWWSQRAGAPRNERGPIRFRVLTRVPEGVVLVDDVFTTGSTLASAGRAIGPVRFSSLVATTAGRMTVGTGTVPSLGGDVTVNRQTNTDHAPSAQAHFDPLPEMQPTRRAIPGIRYREEQG